MILRVLEQKYKPEMEYYYEELLDSTKQEPFLTVNDYIENIREIVKRLSHLCQTLQTQDQKERRQGLLQGPRQRMSN